MCLPGEVDVQVAGESFHSDAILAALSSTDSLTAVLVPEPDSPHEHAVAVYLQGRHVGYLPHGVGGKVQPALLEFSRAQDGRPVSCPAVVHTHEVGHQVVL